MRVKQSKVIAEPDSEPITIDAAKNYLKVFDNEDDSLIDLLRRAAREHIEQLTGLSLVTQTRELKLDYFPFCDTIRLTNGPFQSVTHVKYYDANDVLQTIPSTDYWFDSSDGRIQIKNTWPLIKTRQNAVVIEYVAGFEVEKVPGPLIEAMQIVMGYMYEHRDQSIPKTLVDAFIGQYLVIEDVSY